MASGGFNIVNLREMADHTGIVEKVQCLHGFNGNPVIFAQHEPKHLQARRKIKEAATFESVPVSNAISQRINIILPSHQLNSPCHCKYTKLDTSQICAINDSCLTKVGLNSQYAERLVGPRGRNNQSIISYSMRHVRTRQDHLCVEV